VIRRSKMKIDTMVLLVMTRARRANLLRALEYSVTDVLAVCSCKEAQIVLKGHLPVQVVVTDARLPDGTWNDVVQDVLCHSRNARVVVCSRRDEVLTSWNDYFERGAYDLLIEPYSKDQVKRTVESAASASFLSRDSSSPLQASRPELDRI
jgi:DNA-binding NtrC family response regulator